MQPEARILDYGCGYGRALRTLHDAGFANTVGLDSSTAMIERGRAQWPDLNLQSCPGRAIPFADHAFDAVLLLAVLTCLPRDADLEALLHEVRRVLRPGGLLLVNDFLLGADERNQARYARFVAQGLPLGVFNLPEGATMRHFAPERLRELLADFSELAWREQTFTTMNGNSARGVTVLAQNA